MNALKHWMSLASPEQKIMLAKYAKTSVGTLQQIAGGYRSDGEAHTSPEMARNIELATNKFLELPRIKREQLCPACAACEFVRKCRKQPKR